VQAVNFTANLHHIYSTPSSALVVALRQVQAANLPARFRQLYSLLAYAKSSPSPWHLTLLGHMRKARPDSILHHNVP